MVWEMSLLFLLICGLLACDPPVVGCLGFLRCSATFNMFCHWLVSLWTIWSNFLRLTSYGTCVTLVFCNTDISKHGLRVIKDNEQTNARQQMLHFQIMLWEPSEFPLKVGDSINEGTHGCERSAARASASRAREADEREAILQQRRAVPCPAFVECCFLALAIQHWQKMLLWTFFFPTDNGFVLFAFIHVFTF